MQFWRGLVSGLLLAAGAAGDGPGRAVEAHGLGLLVAPAQPEPADRSPDWVIKADAPAVTAGASATEKQIAAALVETLRIGIGTVVATLGRSGGFADDPAIRIPLPGGLAGVRDGLVGAGLGPLVVDLENRMNQAAEAAMPEAGRVLGEALAALTILEARAILEGPHDAATRYFAAGMLPRLSDQMTPIVEAELRDAGAVAAFDSFVAAYAALPLMPDIRGSLTRHVVDQALAGLIHRVAEQERAIRADPGARTTELLRGVFGDS